jgi:hypothetical protein
MVGELATSYSEREGSGWEGHGAIAWLDKAARGPPGFPRGSESSTSKMKTSPLPV